MDKKWACPRCTFVNPLSAAKCQICAFGKPKDAKSQKTWACRLCTFKNPESLTACHQCNAPKPLDKVPPFDRKAAEAKSDPLPVPDLATLLKEAKLDTTRCAPLRYPDKLAKVGENKYEKLALLTRAESLEPMRSRMVLAGLKSGHAVRLRRAVLKYLDEGLTAGVLRDCGVGTRVLVRYKQSTLAFPQFSEGRVVKRTLKGGVVSLLVRSPLPGRYPLTREFIYGSEECNKSCIFVPDADAATRSVTRGAWVLTAKTYKSGTGRWRWALGRVVSYDQKTKDLGIHLGTCQVGGTAPQKVTIRTFPSTGLDIDNSETALSAANVLEMESKDRKRLPVIVVRESSVPLEMRKQGVVPPPPPSNLLPPGVSAPPLSTARRTVPLPPRSPQNGVLPPPPLPSR